MIRIESMNKDEIYEFLDSLKDFSDENILEFLESVIYDLKKCGYYELEKKFKLLVVHQIKNIDIKIELIKKYFYNVNGWQIGISYLYDWDSIVFVLKDMSIYDKVRILKELFGGLEFKEIKEKMNFPQDLQFGIELEYTNFNFETLKKLFNFDFLKAIMLSLNIPINIVDSIIQKIDFEKENQFDKWIFSMEDEETPEASSPIIKNELEDLNEISAICVLFKALGVKINGGVALHINVGTNYFKGNTEALNNLLIIWKECEELFYKIANEENEVIRTFAFKMASPIKAYIEKTLEEGNLELNNDEDFNRFLYNVQVRNRLKDLLGHLFRHANLEFEFFNAETEEDHYKVFRKYMKQKRNDENSIKYTSINFNHMNFENFKTSGRIEFRIFNSTFSPTVIIENLVLIGKLCEVSLEIALNPKYKRDKFESLLCHDITELEKLNILLDLLFDDEKEKEIYRSRWVSIYDKEFYKKFKIGEETFKSVKEYVKK